jgi:hypothetical protein
MKSRMVSRRAPPALLSIVAALAVAASGPAWAQDAPTGSWAAEADGGNFASGASATDGVYLYVIGGMQDGGWPDAFQQVRRYDPANNAWTTMSMFPFPVVDNAAAYLGGKLYSMGGVDLTSDVTDAIVAYDIANDTWASAGVALSSPRQRLAAAALGNRLYAMGGFAGDFSDANDEIDPAGLTVTPRLAMPVPLSLHALAAVPALDRLYVVTGFDAAGPVATTYEFNPDANTWTTLAPLQNGSGEAQPRYAARAFSLNDRVYVTGGFFDFAEVATWEFNPAANAWARRADMSFGRQFHGAAAIGDRGYVYGGLGLTTGEEFTPPAVAPPPSNHAPRANAGPDQTVEATSADGASVTLDGSASDDQDGDNLTYAWSPVNASGVGPTVTLPLGENVITLTVSDGQETDTDTVTILVVDTEAPSMSGLAASPNKLWSPNKDMRAVTLTVTAQDAADAAPECEIVSVSSNQPVGKDGDWEITGAMALNLRADRSNGETRIYTIQVRCTDSSGNSSLASVTVCVPHNQGNGGDVEAKKAQK